MQCVVWVCQRQLSYLFCLPVMLSNYKVVNATSPLTRCNWKMTLVPLEREMFRYARTRVQLCLYNAGGATAE